MKHKKILYSSGLALTFALVFAGLNGINNTSNAFASTNPITLYTAGGVIEETNYTSIKDGSTYRTSDIPTSIDKMPIPSIEGDDENVSFVGWYTDAKLTVAATSVVSGSNYYAKWSRTKTEYNGDYMSYAIDGNVDARGYLQRGKFPMVYNYLSGQLLRTTDAFKGFASYYSITSNAKNSGTYVAAAKSGDPYVVLADKSTTTNIYVAAIPHVQGSYVVYSYYLQNRGNTTVSNINFGVAGDIQIGANDIATLRHVTDKTGYYITMNDANLLDLHILRLYYSNNKLATDVSSVWTGPKVKYLDNVFNESRSSVVLRDSAVALSWKGMTLAPGETTEVRFALGAGSNEEELDFSKPTLTYGDTTVEINNNQELGTQFTVREPNSDADHPIPDGYEFDSWNTKKDATGDRYLPGDTITITDDTKLYAIYTQPLSTVKVNVNLDGASYTGRKVELYKDKVKAYTLDYSSNAYEVSEVENGTYEIYVDNKNVGKTITTDSSTSTLVETSLSYYTMQVKVENDTLWNDAKVTLRNTNGVIYKELPFKRNEGTTAIFESIELESTNTYNVYVENENVNKTISAQANKNKVSVKYFEMTVTLLANGSPITNTNVEFKTSSESFKVTSSTGIYKTRVLDSNKKYTIGVANTIDQDTTPIVLDRNNKYVTLNYTKVTTYTYELNYSSTYSPKLYKTIYVREGSDLASIPGAYIDGLYFNGWGLSPWTLTESDFIEYNFPILAENLSSIEGNDITLYAHFSKIQVLLNDYVKVDENGVTQLDNSLCNSLKFGNFSIGGYGSGACVKGLLISTNNVTTHILNQTGVTIKTGNLSTQFTGDETDSDAITITFNNLVTMEVAQNYVRNNLVFTPTGDFDISIGVSNESFTVSNDGVTPSNWTNVTNISDTSINTFGVEGQTRYYNFTNSLDFTGQNTGDSGIVIKGDVYFYIPKGVTINITGAAGLGQIGGGAGIEMTSGSLYLYGEGTINIKGGAAAKGLDGQGNEAIATFTASQLTLGTYKIYAGGNGGAGGGGAGAGIGTKGGTGGNGGTGGKNVDGSGNDIYYSNSNISTKEGFYVSGGKGGNGEQAASFSGNVYVSKYLNYSIEGGNGNIQLSNSGSLSASSLSALRSLLYEGTAYSNGNKPATTGYYATLGGTGAGGGNGYPGQAIGNGGTGGAGGGGGTSGSIVYCDNGTFTTAKLTGGFGLGGNGYKAGRDGKACGGSYNEGGEGGTSTNLLYEPTTNYGSTVLDVNCNLAFASYTPSETNQKFVGYQVINTTIYNEDGVVSFEKNNNLYSVGDLIQNHNNLATTIVYKPLVVTVGQKYKDDSLTSTKTDFDNKGNTYYTYTIKFIENCDGLNTYTNLGEIKLVNTADSSDIYYISATKVSGDFAYTMSITKDASFKVYLVDGTELVDTLNSQALLLQANSEKTVNFSRLNVVVSGLDPMIIYLKDTAFGSYGPTLDLEVIDEDVFNFTTYKQIGTFDDSKEYNVYIDNTMINGKIAKYGKTVSIGYSKAKIYVDTNTQIDNVKAVSNGVSLDLVYDDNKGYYSSYQSIDESTEYELYINGTKANINFKFNAAAVVKTIKYYKVTVYTKADNTIKSLGKPTASNIEFNEVANGKYEGYVISSDSFNVTHDGNVINVTPSSSFDAITYDYYSISYTSTNSTGECPLDAKLYYKGTSTKVLDSGTLVYAKSSSSSVSKSYYFDGWKYNGNLYYPEDNITVNEPIVLSANWQEDYVIVQYYFGTNVVASHNEYKLTDTITTIAASKVYNDNTFEYDPFTKWYCSYDGQLYDAETDTGLLIGNIKNDDSYAAAANGIKYVDFIPVYNVTYLNEIEVSAKAEFSEVNYTSDATSTTIKINYSIKTNCENGVDKVTLIPDCPEGFKVSSITSSFGSVSGNTITFTNRYFGTDDVFATVTFTTTNKDANTYIADAYNNQTFNFGLVTAYRTTSIETLTDNRSVFSYNDTEVDNEIKVTNTPLASVKLVETANITFTLRNGGNREIIISGFYGESDGSLKLRPYNSTLTTYASTIDIDMEQYAGKNFEIVYSCATFESGYDQVSVYPSKNDSDEKLIAFHAFSFMASGGTISGTCYHTGSAETISVTLTTPNKEYDGLPYNLATLTENGWTDLGISLPHINYYQGSTLLESAPINVGDYLATINYYGNETQTAFSIVPTYVTNSNLFAIEGLEAKEYTSNAIEPTIDVYYTGVYPRVKLATTDYQVIYSNNTNVGIATVTITISGGNYTFDNDAEDDKIIANFAITKKTIVPSLKLDSITGKEFDGTTAVTGGMIELTGSLGIDNPTATGTFSWISNEAGTNKINVTNIELDLESAKNYTLSTTTLSEIVVPASISINELTSKEVDINVEEVTYTGKAIKPALTINYNNLSLVLNKDYTVTYSNNVNASNNAIADITFIGNYSGTKQKLFTINKYEVVITWNNVDLTYTGLDQSNLITPTYKDVNNATVSLAVSFNDTFKNANNYVATASFKNNETNYVLPNIVTNNYSISKAYVIPSINTVDSKGYDGSTNATGTLNVTGGVNGETPTATGTFTWASSNVGENKVSVTNIELASAYKENYELTRDSISETTIASSSILPVNVLPSDVEITVSNKQYTGSTLEPEVTIIKGSYQLVLGTDYQVSYQDNTAVGKGKAVITFIGYFAGNATVEFTISPKVIDIIWDNTTFTYNGFIQTINASYLDVEGNLKQLVVTTNNEFKNAGNYEATVSFKNNETNYVLPDVITKEYVMNKVTLTSTINMVNSKEYDGNTNAIGTISLIGSVNNEVPVATYVVTWNSSNVGESNVIVSNIELAETWKTNYELASSSISSTNVYPSVITTINTDNNTITSTTDKFTYNGNTHTLNMTIKDGEKVLVEGVDYEVSYSNNKNAGQAKATITYIGNYSGTKDVFFTIEKAVIDMSNVTWTYTTPFVYDGETKSITITNVPSIVTIKEYSYNQAKEAGEYVANVIFDYDTTCYTLSKADFTITWVIKANLISSEEKDEDSIPLGYIQSQEGFDKDVEVSVDIKSDNNESLENIQTIADYSSLINNNEKVHSVIDVKVAKDGINVQPLDITTNGFTIRLKIPTNLLGKEFKLFHAHSATDVSEIIKGEQAAIGTYVIKGAYVETVVDKLSEFTFVGFEEKTSEEEIATCFIHWLLLAVLFFYLATCLIGFLYMDHKGNMMILIATLVYILVVGTLSVFTTRGCVLCIIFTLIDWLALIGVAITFLLVYKKSLDTKIDQFALLRKKYGNSSIIQKFLKRKPSLNIQEENNQNLTESDTFFLVTTNEELAQEIQKDHKNFVKSDKKDWYKMNIDESYKDSKEVFNVLKKILDSKK